MNYTQSLNYLNSLNNFEKIKNPKTSHFLNLDRMRLSLERLNHPEIKFPSVLVGGTKGKGSVAFYLSESLRASGYPVGLYTSPHLEDVRERIVVGGKWISKEDFARLSTHLKNVLLGHCEPTLKCYFVEAKQSQKEDCFVATAPRNDRYWPKQVTYFEFLTLLAFLYFKEQKVKLAVLEAGLGGRLDATNCVDPLLTILTPISLDHTQILGKTLSKIAKEKSFLIHAGRPVITAKQEFQARKVITARCKEMRAPLTRCHPRAGEDHRDSRLRGNDKLALYALENFSLVLKALRLLKGRYKFQKISLQKAARVFQTKIWPGRFELIRKNPPVLLDGAHNPASISRLVESLKFHYPKKPIDFVVGIANDKDAKGILKTLSRMKPERLILTRFQNPRALSPRRLARIAKGQFRRVVRTKESKEALRLIQDHSRLTVVTGSLYLVGEIRKILADHRSPITENHG